jgi:hypothetical protein
VKSQLQDRAPTTFINARTVLKVFYEGGEVGHVDRDRSWFNQKWTESASAGEHDAIFGEPLPPPNTVTARKEQRICNWVQGNQVGWSPDSHSIHSGGGAE